MGDEVAPGDVDLGTAIDSLAPLYAAAGRAPPAAPQRFLPALDEQVAAVWDAAAAV